LINQGRNTLPKRISDQELGRRWKAVRQQMKERDIDFLIFQSNVGIMPGYVKWFTDLPVNHYSSSVIFPREDDMITIWHGGRPPAEPFPAVSVVRGVKKRISVPIIQSLSYSTAFDAEKVVEELTPFKNCHIGFVGMGFISASLYKYVTEHLNTAKFEDATDLVDNIKVIKSDEEISAIRETCKLEDELFEYASTLVRPGRLDTEIRIEIIKRCREWGTTDPNIMVIPGVKEGVSKPGPRILEKGDYCSILIETDSPTGMWAELGRTFSIGKPAPEIQEQFEVAKEAQKLTVGMLKPGVSPRELFEANNQFLTQKGYAPETRIYAHGQGYDLVERPGIVEEETMKIQGNMLLAVHPAAASARARVGICDNYFVHKSGEVERLTKTRQEIFVV
jgi:Xaa-Pro aminopeptidase